MPGPRLRPSSRILEELDNIPARPIEIGQAAAMPNNARAAGANAECASESRNCTSPVRTATCKLAVAELLQHA